MCHTKAYSIPHDECRTCEANTGGSGCAGPDATGRGRSVGGPVFRIIGAGSWPRAPLKPYAVAACGKDPHARAEQHLLRAPASVEHCCSTPRPDPPFFSCCLAGIPSWYRTSSREHGHVIDRARNWVQLTVGDCELRSPVARRRVSRILRLQIEGPRSRSIIYLRQSERPVAPADSFAMRSPPARRSRSWWRLHRLRWRRRLAALGCRVTVV